MIDGILERVIAKLGPETKVIATGGQAHLIVERLALPEDRGRGPHAGGPADDLGTEPAPTKLDVNYFNYFTEIEEHFQRARGTGLFLLSPLDWALIESWKNAGVPLEAVLRGIDAAFEKWRGRKVKTQMVNSLAFCAQAVLTEAQIMAGTVRSRKRETAAPPFPLDDLRAYLDGNARAAAPAVSGDRRVAAPPGRGMRRRTTPIWKSWSSASPCSKRR